MKKNKYIIPACCNFILMLLCGHLSMTYFVFGSIELYLRDDLFSIKQMIYYFLSLMSAFLGFSFFIGWRSNIKEIIEERKEDEND